MTVRRPRGVVASVLCGLIRAYKAFVSPWLGRNCRFEPTCSRYFLESVEKHGAWRGSMRGLARICRCHPWQRGGYDPP
jgi:putative membrane protein insertion efficiency factor